jgi:subtilisin family serine protease
LLAAGCGGGGASAPSRSPLETSGTGAAPAGTLSTYAVSSLPAGLAVTVASQSTSSSMLTPAVVTPKASNFRTTISIVPTNGASPYAVDVAQRSDGAHAIYYNEAEDTFGTVAVGIASQASAKRRSSLVRGPAFGPASSLGRAAYSDADVIVRYRAGVSAAGTHLRTGTDGSETRVVSVPEGLSAGAFASDLATRAGVLSVERDALYHKQSVAAVMPDDTHFDAIDQWDMFAIGAPFGWGYTEGSPAIAVAMIDTGVDASSPDFASGKVTFAESVIDGTVVTGLSAVRDTDGHGTDTAGIASANTNDGFGFAGAGFDVSLQIYKVFPDDTAANGYVSDARSSDVTRAIDDAVAHGARVINLSLGTCEIAGVDSAQRAAIDAALAAGVVVVAAAGNERSGTSATKSCAGGSSTIDFPAAYDGVISVGATSMKDGASAANPTLAREYVASYSNAGPGLTLVAPGGDPSQSELSGATSDDPLHWIDNLYTTTAANPSLRCPNPADCTALFSGTSQATPHVSAAAALMLSLVPNLTPSEIRQILIATADDIGDPNQGHGRLDIYRALAAVAGDPNPPAGPWPANFVAIAYVPGGTNRPQIVDATYPAGVPVKNGGTFRIADVPASVKSYKIGVWYDANGDGVVDAGDYFGSSGTCTTAAPCPGVAGGIDAVPVSSGFVLN